jgi:hypothetical protein
MAAACVRAVSWPLTTSRTGGRFVRQRAGAEVVADAVTGLVAPLELRGVTVRFRNDPASQEAGE